MMNSRSAKIFGIAFLMICIVLLILALAWVKAMFFYEMSPANITACTKTIRVSAEFHDDPDRIEDYASLFHERGFGLEKGGDEIETRAEVIEYLRQHHQNTLSHTRVDPEIWHDDMNYRGATDFVRTVTPKNDDPKSETQVIIGEYDDWFHINKGICKIRIRKEKIKQVLLED